MSSSGKRRIIFVSGLSGAGKSVVLHTLEDLDFYCIDNFPIGLLDKLSEQTAHYPGKIAISINARNQEIEIPALPDHMQKFRKQGIETELLFLEADKEILTRRYSETRRKHPFSDRNNSLPAAIENEACLLDMLSAIADLKIDTSHTSVHTLRQIIRERVAGRKEGSLSIQLLSFGFKHGIPRDADFVFDVRCLPNPYWEISLRPFSGKDSAVIDYLQNHTLVLKMKNDIVSFLNGWIPFFAAENRSYLTIAIGCTGGRHRSVYLVDSVINEISAAESQIISTHRDL